MKEEFLHYLWQFKKMNCLNLKTVSGEEITIIKTGDYFQNSGPDFFNAQLIIGNQKWAGTVEIHLRSSDWYLHQHEKDENYSNVILHVVWEHDAPVFSKNNVEVPVLELKNYVSKETIESYTKLKQKKSWIFCENQIKDISEVIFKNWQERLFLERLERKSNLIELVLSKTKNDWEATLFCLLAKNFGLNVNGEVFFKMAQNIPFSIIRKEHFEVENLEALFFGFCSLFSIDMEDSYAKDLFQRYEYSKEKYQLKNMVYEPLQFFKLRPDNFPTIRLAQLAMLYHKQNHLLDQIINSKSIQDYYQLFNVSVSPYWQTHYMLDKTSAKKTKKLSKSFIDLVIINTVVPFLFAYFKSQGKDNVEFLLELMQQIAPEKNNIVDKFSLFGIPSKNAFHTQALLQLKNEYCNPSKCLQCAVGIELLKS